MEVAVIGLRAHPWSTGSEESTCAGWSRPASALRRGALQPIVAASIAPPPPPRKLFDDDGSKRAPPMERAPS
ncbi:hypothetical protein BST61_g6757 [Cercospora zeina]